MPESLKPANDEAEDQPPQIVRSSLTAFFRSPLAQRAALVVFAAVLVVEALILLPSYLRQEQQLLDNLSLVGLQWMRSQMIVYERDGNAQSYAGSLLSADTITGVAIYGPDNVLIASAGESLELAGPTLSDNPVLAEWRSPSGNRYERIIPGDSSPLGTAMVLRLDSTEVDTQLTAFVWRIAGLTLIISIVLTIATLIAMGSLVLRPLLVLRRVLAEGGGTGFVEKAGPEMNRQDEIGDTFRAIAALLSDLSDYREDLGRLVLERTMDLTSANQRLRTSEAKIRASEVRIRAIMDNSPSYIYLKSVDGRYLLVNKHVEESLGLPADEIVGKTNENFYPPELSAMYAQQDREVIATKSMVAKEIDVPRTDGPPRTSIIYKFPIFGNAGDVESVGAVIVDITGRKAAEAEVAEQSKVLRKVLDNIDNGILMLDENMNIETFNDRHLTLYGVPPETMAIGGPIRTALRYRVEQGHYGPGDIDTLTTERLKQIRNTKDEHVQERTIAGRIVETRWSTGPDGSYINVATDITERKNTEFLLEKAKTQAEQAAHSRAELVAIVSHEVRTPMNGVLGMARLLQDSDLDFEQRDMVDTIVQSGDNLVRIVSDLLDVSKIEAGKFDLELGPFIAADVMEQCVSVMTAKAQEKGLRINLEMASGIPVVLVGDPFRLRQVITNLVSNAIRFTTTGSIDVAVKENGRADDYVDLFFAVIDTGVGIKSKDQEKLFTPYEQGSVEFARKSGGTGLGLAICSHLVQHMGGYIQLDSIYGEGSSFSFTLRFPIDKQTPAHELRQNARKPRGLETAALARDAGPFKILQVEDDPTNQKVVDAILTRLGHSVTTVSNGSEALDRMNSDTFDVIIMDRHMPVLDGLETTRAIRSMEEPACDTPIIGVTASAIETELDMCRDSGMSSVLTKPVDGAELISAVLRLTGNGPDTASIPHDKPVLVVDDVSINRAVARQQLEKLDVPYTLAESGKEALRLLKADNYGLVLVDIAMPGMDGIEFTRHVREGERDQKTRVPLIAVTGYVTGEDRKRFLAAGMDDCLTKPVVLEDLADILGKWLPSDSDGHEDDKQAVVDNPDDSSHCSESTDSNTASPIDLVLLGDILGEDDDNEKLQWVREFIDQFPPMLEQVLSDVVSQDRASLHNSAHAAKGAANSAAAVPLAKTLAQLEEVSNDAEWSTIEALISTIQSQFGHVVTVSERN